MYLAAYENTKCKPPNLQITTYVEFNTQYMLFQAITVYLPSTAQLPEIYPFSLI